MTYTRAPDVTITGGDYEHTLDIAGVYDDVSLAYNAMRVQQIFDPMLTDRRFEACELSLANYIILRANGDRSMTAIPVFPFRAFRHSLIITRRDSPLVALEQLARKRIGVEDYSMTAAVWFRGLIEDEYSVDHRSITWVTPRKQRFPFPPNAPVEVVEESLEDLLCDDAIDGMLGFATRDSALPTHERKLRPVLQDSQAVEAAYFERTSIYPIMHTVVVRADMIAKFPAVLRAAESAYARAKENAYRRKLGATCAPWAKEHWAKTFQMFGNDPLPYGLTPLNRRAVSMLADYLARQGFIDQAPDIDDLFRVPAVITTQP